MEVGLSSNTAIISCCNLTLATSVGRSENMDNCLERLKEVKWGHGRMNKRGRGMQGEDEANE